MNRLGKIGICAALLLAVTLLPACGTFDAEPQTTPTPTVLPTPSPSPEPVIVVERSTPLATPSPTPTEVPTPSPTPVPPPVYVTIGAVGDIMIPGGILWDAQTEDRLYDFHTLFAPFAELFSSVDLMCGNLEVPLAGKEVGYSGMKDEKTGLFSFNAPDSLLDTLKEYGVDMLTTANNHTFDKGVKGLRRTVETLRAAGFYQTGSYLDREDREKPCIVEVEGIRIGFVASTRLMNQAFKDVRGEEERTAVGYLTDPKDPERLSQDVLDDLARVREAGAEFVIVFAHWDYANTNPTAAITKGLARQLFEAGADCIVGSHPHLIKGAEYVTVEREDGPYTGLVLYSLGDFTANQSEEMMIGLFACLTLEKNYETGRVTLYDAAVIPTLTMRRKVEAGPRFTVMPIYTDTDRITGLSEPLTETEIAALMRARAYALNRLGSVEGLRLLDESSGE